jgi:hypothetical protein
VEPVQAAADLIALNAAVYRSSGFSVGIGLDDLRNAGFPPALEELALDDLIGLILATSTLERDPRQPQKPAVTDLNTVKSVVLDAACVLRAWPTGLHNRLCALLPRSDSDRAAVTFRSLYGDFYEYLLDMARHQKFHFLIDGFNMFVVQYWPGILRGQHRLAVEPSRKTMRWIPASQAAKLARLAAPQFSEFVRGGTLTGVFITPSKSRGRTECWLEREELLRWVASRDADFVGFISQREAMRVLGLTAATLNSLGRNGIVELCKGPDRGFPPGVHFRRRDVEVIVKAFSDHSIAEEAPVLAKWIPLREALRRYLGRDGFCAFVRAMLSGALRPVGYDPEIRGILGFRFSVQDIKRYCPAMPKQSAPPGFVTYRVAAARLGSNTEIVRNLVAEGLLHSYRGTPRGVLMLRALDVEGFAAQYVPIKIIAERFDTGSRTVAKILEENGAEVLVIHLPGKGNKLFVRKGQGSAVALRALTQKTKQASPQRRSGIGASTVGGTAALEAKSPRTATNSSNGINGYALQTGLGRTFRPSVLDGSMPTPLRKTLPREAV